MVNDDGQNANNGGGRERGILTTADREFLSMSDEERKNEYSAPARSQRRRAIASRIENALLDFPILAGEIEDETIQDVFGPERGSFTVDGEEVVGSQIQTGQMGVPFGVMFLLRIARGGEPHALLPDSHLPESVEHSLKPFLDDLERGIQIWLNDFHNLTGDVDVSVSVDDLRTSDELVEDIREGDAHITGIEKIETISQLSRAGWDSDEIAELLGFDTDDEDSESEDVDDEEE